MSLPDLRRQLDSIDDEIICLLQRRAEIASAVGRHKREQGLPFYQPERERQILERIAGRDLGRFPVRSAQAVFREIITACRELQHPTRIAYLGPEGTFTEAAARGFFGEAASLQPQSDFRAVFEAVTARQTDFGLVPVENSTAGAIREVLDLLALHNLTIVGETYFDVHLSLLSRAAELTDVEVIYSKDAALEQCRDWLRANLPAARLEAVASTADGARRA
ncbi:MAG: chorismate mutase, partial [Armatimonadetes bacterium]|nr:chorismate mutase [Armatimonadota bacterium]